MNTLAVLAGGDIHEAAVVEIRAMHAAARQRLGLTATTPSAVTGRGGTAPVPTTLRDGLPAVAAPVEPRGSDAVRFLGNGRRRSGPPALGVGVGRADRSARPFVSGRRPRAGTRPAAGGGAL